MIESTKVPVITIDGPTASGKGTIAQSIATSLAWHYLDSGALYRGMALISLRTGSIDAKTLAEKSEAQQLRVGPNCDGAFAVWLNGEDVSEAIRHEDCGLRASMIASDPHIRALLVQKQRAFREKPGLVADGRDMGTVIFPDADLKLFLTAGVEARAQRRYKQLIDKGIDASLSGLLADLRARDQRDQERDASPLVKAKDAITIDTTQLSVEETMSQIGTLLKEHGWSLNG